MGERGPYVTGNRLLGLERELARIEGRLLARIDEQDAEIRRLRDAQTNLFRGLTGAFINVLRDQLGAAPVALPEPKEGQG
jgi:hypothetical protein